MRETPIIPCLIALVTGLVALSATAQDGPHVPTIDELIRIEKIRQAKISPDGTRVLYTVATADFENDRYVTELWQVDATTKDMLQLTHGPKSVSNPQWSPDGKWISFIASSGDDEEKPQLYALNSKGGEAFPLTKSETGVDAYRWSRDSAHIAFTAKEPEDERKKDREEHLGPFEVVRTEYTHTHLFTLEVAEASSEPVEGLQRTNGKEFSVAGFDWSPDGARIAFSAFINPDLINLHTADIYVLSLADDAVARVVSTTGPDTNPKWAPTGDRIAYESVPDRVDFFPYNTKVFVTPAEGGITYSATDDFDENASLLAWKEDGIYFSGRRKMASHLFRVDPLGESLTRLSQPPDLMGSSYSLVDNGSLFAFVADTSRTLADVFIHRAGHALPVPLTSMAAQTRGLILGRRERIEWTSQDGATIEGVLHKPRDFDDAKQYPLLVVIHGGPTGIDAPGLLRAGTRYYPVDQWTGRGALVLQVNYRGSAGYGEAFRTLNMRNLGVGDMWDVMSGVDYLIDQGWVDEARMGCMGWSQGGYISAFLTTNTDRFAAISVGAGISNWATYYYNTDITPFTPIYLGATPSDDPDIYAITSPMTSIQDAQTPTLIQHGENDARVPIPNAYELRQGLEDNGVPVEMIVYEGFGHGINKPRSMRAVMQHNLQWFNHYLWGDPLPDFANPKLPSDETEEGDADEEDKPRNLFAPKSTTRSP